MIQAPRVMGHTDHHEGNIMGQRVLVDSWRRSMW